MAKPPLLSQCGCWRTWHLGGNLHDLGVMEQGWGELWKPGLPLALGRSHTARLLTVVTRARSMEYIPLSHLQHTPLRRLLSFISREPSDSEAQPVQTLMAVMKGQGREAHSLFAVQMNPGVSSLLLNLI